MPFGSGRMLPLPNGCKVSDFSCNSKILRLLISVVFFCFGAWRAGLCGMHVAGLVQLATKLPRDSGSLAVQV